MIDIKKTSGQTLASVEPSEGSKRKFTLMKEDFVMIKFSLASPIVFGLGSYIETDHGRFEICDEQRPSYNTNTGGYDYELRFDASYWKWKNKIFKFTPEAGGQEASWNLTATLDVQLGVFLRNLKALGYSYNGVDYTFSIDGSVENKAVLMSYDNTNLLDALFSMASKEKWNCDCWITDNVIHFGRCEFGDAVKVEQAVNAEITSSESKGIYATRVYAFGGTKNIPQNYRPTDENAVVNGIVQKRLMLPAGTPYIDAYRYYNGKKVYLGEPDYAKGTPMPQEEAIENVIILEDVFPKMVGTMSAITTKEYTDKIENQDGTTTEKKWNAYRYKDNSLKFSKEYILPGQELNIYFQSGKLNGMVFAVKFNPDGKPEKLKDESWNTDAQLWEIVRNETYGRPLPDEVLKPADGDKFVLTGFDTKLVGNVMVPEAEKKLKAETEKYVKRTMMDDGTYTATMYPSWVYEDEINRTFGIGQKINLVAPGLFEKGRVSRVIGYEFYLDIPYDHPAYTVGESATYSRIGELEDKIESLTYKGQTYQGGGGSGVYIIRTNDQTVPTNSNVFSALRSLAMFLRKDQDDRTLNKISTDKAFEVGNYVAGASGAIIYKDKETGHTEAEVDKLRVRMKAYFETLEIINTNSVGGKQVLSPGGSMKCIKVEDVETCWRCYLLVEQDGAKIENRFRVDDLAYSKMFNAKEGVGNKISNNYYWRKVVAIGEDYIDLSKSDCDAGSDAPMVGDIINQRGNKTDKDRQNFIELSSVDAFSPSITLYQGVDSYSLVGKDVVSYGVDKTTGKAFMNVYGDMYVGDRGHKSYMRYTQENGLEIMGKLGVGTTYNGKSFESFMHNTFTKQPTDSEGYGVGDMWVNATYPAEPPYKYEDQLLRCVTAKEAGEPFSIDHWVPAASYKGDKVAEEALKKAEEAGKLANELNQTVGGIKDLTDKVFADGIISVGEKAAIEKMLKQIETTKQQVVKTYSEVYNNALLTGVPKTNLKNGYSAFITACDELVKAITDTIADDKATSTEIALVDGKYDTFNVKYGDCMAYLAAARKSIEDSIKTKVDKTIEELGGYKYLKEALKEQTLIQNGLVLTSLIGVGQTQSTGQYLIMAGISGNYDDSKRGGGIASWFGGAMVDKFDYYDSATGKFNVPVGVRPATGVDRMDGTGYRANGALWWDNDGKVHADPLSFFVGESTVGGLLASFQVVLKNDKRLPEYIIPKVPFQKMVISDYLALTDKAYLRYDAENNSVYVVGPNGEQVNFYATGDVSAYGKGTSTGGGGSITIVDNLLSTSTDAALSANQGRVLKRLIDSKSSVSSWEDITDKPSWITSTKPSYSWNEITGKPSTFNPSAHNHPISQITGLQSALDGKSPTSHNHNSSYVSSLGVSGKYLTWVKGGVTNNITVPYAARTDNLIDSGDGRNITAAYSKPEIGYDSFTWLVGWNGSELRTVNKNLFSKSDHWHTYLYCTTVTDLNAPSLGTSPILRFSVFNGTATNSPTKYNNANSVLSVSHGNHGTAGPYGYQLAQTNGTNRLYFRQWTAGSVAPWRGFAFLDDTIENSNHLGGVLAKDYARRYYFYSHDQYVCLGTLNTSQDGEAVYFDIFTGFGFNGNIEQNKHFSVFFRTSNGSSNAAGKYYAAECLNYDEDVYTCYIVQNSPTSYTFWIGRTMYSGESILEVKCSRNSSFTFSGQVSNTLPSNAAAVANKRILYTNERNIKIEDNNNPYYELNYKGQGWYIQLYNDIMYVGMGTGTSIRIDGYGNLIVPKEVTAYSDERLKKNIRPLKNRGYITPITYEKDGKESIGFSAQEVRKLYPELVMEDKSEDKYLSVNYQQYTAVLQAQIIEMQKQIDELKKKWHGTT